MIKLEKGMTIVFQGDSITDAGRTYDNDSFFGGGYPLLITSILKGMYPELDLKIYNRGISGNRAIDLKNRWDRDCIDLKPDVVSILIGINDMWRRYDSNDPTSTGEFENNYRYCLEKLKENNIKIIILEPFLTIVRDELNAWKSEDLNAKIAVAKKLAKEFNAIYIPLEDIFQELCKVQTASYWAEDGVHPTMAGHGIITKEYLKVFGIDIK